MPTDSNHRAFRDDTSTVDRRYEIVCSTRHTVELLVIGVTPDNASRVAGLVALAAPLIPRWVTQLRVRVADMPASAEVMVKDDYRNPELTLCATFFDDSPEGQREVMYHEIAHLLIGPLSEFAQRTIAAITQGNELLAAMVTEQLRVAVEQATSDVTEAFLRLAPLAHAPSNSKEHA